MEEARRNILGGETAIWTEQTDGGNILSKVSVVRVQNSQHSDFLPVQMEPRTAALGASLWLGDLAGTWRDAHQGIVQHRERLVSRDVMADQITQRWCLQNPGLCLLQEEEEGLQTPSTVETCPTITTSAPPTTTSNGQLGCLNLYLVMIVIVTTFISPNQ